LEYQDLLIGVEDAIGTVTLNRPAKLNAFANQMRQEIAAAIRELAERDDVRVIVLTGAGRAFCAGADVAYLKELAESVDEEALRAVVNAGSEAVAAIREAPQPVIAALNGPAAGAGASLALACDLRIAAESASFGLTFNRIGLHPDWGGTYFLPRLVGPAAAAEIIFTGAMIPADEAHRLGIYSRVVPDDRLAEETAKLARALAAKPRLPLELAKRALQKSLDASLDEMLAYELAAQLRCAASPDAIEGITAFLEKREPRFGRAL
jgi:2-(1,2-epoxy-1,2-dihydrophenyl)acetyl-CoA isomerase